MCNKRPQMEYVFITGMITILNIDDNALRTFLTDDMPGKRAQSGCLEVLSLGKTTKLSAVTGCAELSHSTWQDPS